MTIPFPPPGPFGLALPFVGRDRELKLLRDALGVAIAGLGAVALIGGEAGIGKTRLAELVCGEATERGALVLVGRCYDLTETAPFAPWIELFSTYIAERSLPAIPDAVARCEIGGEVTSRAALFAAVYQFLGEVTNERPVVLLLDDQHWADEASLDLLRYLARYVVDLPVLVLVTYRADEVAPVDHFSRILSLLVREARALRVNLHPLASDDLWAIIRPRYRLDAAEEAQLTSFLHERTEGNPFFAGELLQALEDDGVLRQGERRWILDDLGQASTPILIEQIVGGRLARLDEDDRRLLSVAAVLGHEVTLESWADVAEVDEERLLDVLDSAWQARLLEEMPDGRGARFVHALVRQVIYESVPPSRRRRLHRRAAVALAEAPAADPDAVAFHYRQSGDERAAEWLIRAGERAQLAYSWQAAAERFEAALEVLGASEGSSEARGWLLVRLARVRRYAAPELGLAHLEEAGRIAETSADRPLTGWVLWQSGLLKCLGGQIARGLEQLEAGVSALAALTPDECERLTELEAIIGMVPDAYQDRGTLAQWLSVAGRYQESVEWAAPYAAESTKPDKAAGSFGDAYVALGAAYAALGNPEGARAAYARARVAYDDGRHDVHLARASTNELRLVVLPYEADNLVERRRLEADAAAAWLRGSGAFADSLVDPTHLPLRYVEGRWSEGRSAELALRANGTSTLRAEAAQWLGPVARAQGDCDLAWELIFEWLPGGPTTDPGDTLFCAAQSMQSLAAQLAMDAGDLATARAWLEAYDRWLAWSGAVIGQAEGVLGWARYWYATGNTASACSQAEAALEYASAPRQPLAQLAAHRMMAEIETATGRHDEAATHLEAALALADACAAPYERALTLLVVAERHVAAGESALPVAALAEARSVFESLGAAPALERTDALAERLDGSAGAREVSANAMPVVPSAIGPFPAGLSKRELDVLRLLATGQTNREIADRLFLSPKTVEHHIGRILAKTELPNRAAAAAFAQRHGIT